MKRTFIIYNFTKESINSWGKIINKLFQFIFIYLYKKKVYYFNVNG